MGNPMQTQQEYLRVAKAEMARSLPGITWDEMAILCGINPRAFKTYRMPESSADYRCLPNLARAAIERVIKSENGGT